MSVVSAYSSVSKDELDSRGIDWNELAEYVEEIGPVVEEIATKQGIDESPPQIKYGEIFEPKGWVGTYPGELTVTPDKIDDSTYNALLHGAAGLVESFGLRTATAGLPFSPNTLDDERSQYLSYSRQLIQLTETIISNRLPVVIERAEHIGRDAVGSINVQKTLREQSRQTGQIVSTKTNFSVDSPIIRLLYQFHADLQQRLINLQQDYGISDPQLKRQAAYHQRVRRTKLPGDTIDRDTSVTPDEVTTLQEESSAPIQDLANLWLAFQRDQAMKIDWKQRFESAIKPISAVYELWCLNVVLDILTDLYGEYQANDLERIPSKYDFPEAGVTLYYDRSLASCSNYITEHFKPQAYARAGNPDFLLTESASDDSEEEVVRWVADAKFQRADNLDTSGTLRFLAYLVDYLQSEQGCGTLLCIGGTPERPSATIEGRQNYIRTIGPDSVATIKDNLRKDITGRTSSPGYSSSQKH